MLDLLKNVLWSFPTMALLTGTGIYFTFKSRFYPIRRLGEIIKSVKNAESASEISSLRGLMTALGGTVGVGSITGVAYAITQGGAGALFWMWVSSFFCMMLKYAENYLTVKESRSRGVRGSAATLLSSMGKKKTAVFFAFSGILASFGSGNMAQANAFSLAAAETGADKITVGIIFALLLIPAVLGGQKIIARLNGVLVPVAAVLFLAAALGITLYNFKEIPHAFKDIFKSAFGISQAGAGITGTAISLALRTGVSKGVFSHEAGMGSSPIAHSAAGTPPLVSARFGIIEVFADTFAVSTLTALALLTTHSETTEEMFFVYFGSTGPILLAAALGIFAYAAVISWCFYSESLIVFLSKKRSFVFIYRILAIISAFFGCIYNAGGIWNIADIFNALMLFPNLYALIIRRKEILY